jgi:hypothetical protein
MRGGVRASQVRSVRATRARHSAAPRVAGKWLIRGRRPELAGGSASKVEWSGAE